MRIGIYARISTRKQDEQNQLIELRQFVANQQGWTVDDAFVYVDKVTGSGTKQRPQFDRMMLDASQKKFDVLVFWALDRLSREGIVKTIGYLEQFKAWGIGYRSYTQPFLDTGNDMANSIVLAVLAAVAKQERITLSERTKAGIARSMAEHKKAGTVLVIGRPKVQVDVAAAHKMQKAGMGLRPIAAKLGCSVNTLRGAL